jgi:hypothetical protein
MDPFLEDQHYWPDFHQSFMTYWRDMLLERLPDNYDARLEERVRFVELVTEEDYLREPDLAVEQVHPSSAPAVLAPEKLTLKPVTIALPVMEKVRETRIQILHRPGRELVTILELLSPSNKSRTDQGAYLAKRAEVLGHWPRLHLVEVDLLVGGLRLPMRRPLPSGDYYALVSRAERRPKCEVYAWTLRQPLPTIPVPLKSPDADLRIDLGAIFAIAYERGRYQRSIDYASPLTLALNAKDRRWAAKVAKTRKS